MRKTITAVAVLGITSLVTTSVLAEDLFFFRTKPAVRVMVTPQNEASVQGEPTVGTTLIAALSSGAEDPALTYAYQWRRDGVAIDGATAKSYELVVDDVGHTIDFTVTISGDGVSRTAVSERFGPVSASQVSN